MADKKDRVTLKGFFAPGSVPLGGHFADLIDAPLNQKDDGIEKERSGPLKIQAPLPDQENLSPGNEVILVFNDFSDASPNWKITLGNTDEPGLSIEDASNVRLFIQEGTGNVGIGTTTPGATLEVQGVLKLGAIENMETVVNGLDSSVSGLSNRADGLDRSVSGLSDRLDQMQNLINAIEERVNRKLAPGDPFEGGVLFEMTEDDTGLHGLVVRTTDIDATLPGTDPAIIDTAAVLAMPENAGWTFPDLAQLQSIRTALHISIPTIGDFLETAVYVSSEAGANTATLVFDFTDGSSKELTTSESKAIKIRLVRAF